MERCALIRMLHCEHKGFSPVSVLAHITSFLPFHEPYSVCLGCMSLLVLFSQCVYI
jgi:hypothetical protein